METKKQVLYYEHYVYRLEELAAMLYFMTTNDELEKYAREALEGIYGQLEDIKDGVEELFDLATKLNDTLKKYKKCN